MELAARSAADRPSRLTRGLLATLTGLIGIAMEQSGLADAASQMLIATVHGLSPLVELIVLYLVTMAVSAAFATPFG